MVANVTKGWDHHRQNKVQILGRLREQNIRVTMLERAETSLFDYLSQLDGPRLYAILLRMTLTLAELQRLLPGFRHNDLHTNNILLVQRTGSLNQLFTSRTLGLAFQLDQAASALPFHPVLADFGYACALNFRNPATQNAPNGISDRPDPFYDLHTMFNTLDGTIRYNDHQLRARYMKTDGPKGWRYKYRPLQEVMEAVLQDLRFKSTSKNFGRLTLHEQEASARYRFMRTFSDERSRNVAERLLQDRNLFGKFKKQ